MKRIISCFLIITFSIIYIFRACNMDKGVEVSPNHNVSSGRAAGDKEDTKTDIKEIKRKSTVS